MFDIHSKMPFCLCLAAADIAFTPAVGGCYWRHQTVTFKRRAKWMSSPAFYFPSLLFPTLFFSLSLVLPRLFYFTCWNKTQSLLAQWLKSQSSMKHWSRGSVGSTSKTNWTSASSDMKLRHKLQMSLLSASGNFLNSFWVHCEKIRDRDEIQTVQTKHDLELRANLKRARFQTAVRHFSFYNLKWTTSRVVPKESGSQTPAKYPCF